MASFRPGDRVLVEYNGAFYQAAVVDAAASGHFRVRFDGYGDAYDQWVHPAQLRPHTPTEPPEGGAGGAGGAAQTDHAELTRMLSEIDWQLQYAPDNARNNPEVAENQLRVSEKLLGRVRGMMPDHPRIPDIEAQITRGWDLVAESRARVALDALAAHREAVARALAARDVDELQRQRELIVTVLAQHDAALRACSAGRDAIGAAEEDLEAIDALSTSAALQAEAARLIAAARPPRQWTMALLEAGDARKLAHAWQLCERALAPLLDPRFSPVAEAAAFVAEHKSLKAHVESALRAHAEGAQAERLASDARGALRELEEALADGDAAEVTAASDALSRALAAVRADHADHPAARDVLTTGSEALARAAREVARLRDVESARAALDAAAAPTAWLEHALARRDAESVRAARAALEPRVAALRPLASASPEAQRALARAENAAARAAREEPALAREDARRDLLAEAERVLAWLSRALERRQVYEVPDARAAALEVELDVRAQLGAEPAAQPVVARIVEALARCDAAMRAATADERTSEVARRVEPYFAWAAQAADLRDDGAALGHLQQLTALVQPLRAEFPDHPVTQTLAARADKLVADLAPKLGGELMDTRKVEKVSADVARPLGEAEGALRAGDRLALARAVAECNKLVAALRARYAWDAGARAVLARVDALNVALYGRVPAEEGAPVFEVSWKLPPAAQATLNEVKTAYDQFNTVLADQKATFENEVALDGSDLERLDAAERAVRGATESLMDLVRGVEQAVAARGAGVSGLRDPASQLVADVTPVLTRIVQERDARYAAKCAYARANGKARAALDAAARARDEALAAEARGGPDPRGYRAMLDQLTQAEAALAEPRKVLPHRHRETDALARKIAATKIEAEARLRDACARGAERFARRGDVDRAAELATLLAGADADSPYAAAITTALKDARDRRDKAHAEVRARRELLARRADAAAATHRQYFDAWKRQEKAESLRAADALERLDELFGRAALLKLARLDPHAADDFVDVAGERWHVALEPELRRWVLAAARWFDACDDEIERVVRQRFGLTRVRVPRAAEWEDVELLCEVAGARSYPPGTQRRVPAVVARALVTPRLVLVPGASASLLDVDLAGVFA